MAKSSKGRNAGVTGLVDFDGSPTFVMRVARFSRQEGAAALVRTKRGDARRRIRQTTPGGTLMLWGTVRKDGYPEPASLKGASGSVILSLGGTAKQTLAVTVLSSKIDHDDESEDEWQVALVAEVTANPAFAGFGGTQAAAAADPTLDAAATHDGITKTVDPDGLQDQDTFRIDVDGLGDTDAAEATWVTDQIAAYSATRLHMKLRSAAFARTDHWGGTLLVTCARTTSAEDVVNNATSTSIDPQALASQATTAAINATPAAPTGATFAKRGERTQELNDDKTLHVSEYGQRSTAEDLTMPGTSTSVDPLEVESTGRQVVVYDTGDGSATPSVPGGLQLVATREQELNRTRSMTEYAFEVNNSHQKQEFPRTRRQTDASALAQEHAIADVFATSSPPSAPSPPSGMVLVDTLDVPLTPTQSVRVYNYAYVTRETGLERGRYELTTDPNALRTTQRTADVWDTAGGAPSTPSAPAGLKLVDYADVGIDTHPTKVVRVYRWALTDSVDDLTLPKTFTDVDPLGLESKAQAAAVNATPALPAGFVDRGTTASPVGGTNVLNVREGGLRSTVDDVEMPQTSTVLNTTGDPGAADITQRMDETAVRTKVYDTYQVDGVTLATPPAAPDSEPVGYFKLVDVTDKPLNAGKMVRVWSYDKRSARDKLWMSEHYDNTDPDGLQSTAVRVYFTTEGFPDTPPGMYVRGDKTTFIHSGTLVGGTLVMIVRFYGVRTTVHDVEYPGTFLKTDVSALDDERVVTTVTNSATLSFPTNSGSLYLRDYTPTQLTASGLYKHVAVYGRQTRAQEVVNRATRSVAFAEHPRRDVTASILASTNTAAVDAQALADTLVSDATFDQVEATKLHDGKTLLVLSKQASQWELEVETRTFGDLQTEYQLTVGGAVKVFVEDVFEVADGWWVYRLGTVPVRCTIMELTLFKRYSGDTVYAYPDGAGTVNATAFLGLTARCVTYAGTAGRAAVKDGFRYPSCTNVSAVAFERPRRFGYRFRYDSRGIILANDICPGGERWVNSDLSAVSARSWVNASTLGLSATHGIDADFYQTFFGTTP